GSAVLCIDDPQVREILPFVSKPVVTYGFAEDAMVRAENVRHRNGSMLFDAVGEGIDGPQPVTLNLPGRHNVQNALAAIASGREPEIPMGANQKALAEFRGVGRRFQRYGDEPLAAGGRFTLIEDYGHHPVEMEATINAARGAFP